MDDELYVILWVGLLISVWLVLLLRKTPQKRQFIISLISLLASFIFLPGIGHFLSRRIRSGLQKMLIGWGLIIIIFFFFASGIIATLANMREEEGLPFIIIAFFLLVVYSGFCIWQALDAIKEPKTL